MKQRREPGRPAFDADRIDPRDLGLALARLPHDHDLVVAARLALDSTRARLYGVRRAGSWAEHPYARRTRLPRDMLERTALALVGPASGG
jgi:hypothetical protein